MIKIHQTEDYSSFKRIMGNRTINKAQVAKLYESFGNNPGLCAAAPILVNDKMEIIDGQHRFEAWKKLGLPITYYTIDGLSLYAVQILNASTKNWTPLDYAKSYSTLGKTDYDIYLKFRKKFGLSHNVLISYLGDLGGKSDAAMKGGGNTVQSFRRGLFQVPNESASELLCQHLVEAQQFYNRGDCRSFALAFKIAHQHPDYNHKQMMNRLEKLGGNMKDSPYTEDYMRQLEKIYNYDMSKRVKLY